MIGFSGMNAGSVDQANPGAGAGNESAALTLREDSGPPAEAFELEVTTRPVINLIWVGTLLLFSAVWSPCAAAFWRTVCCRSRT